jgi:hypothetical protein
VSTDSLLRGWLPSHCHLDEVQALACAVHVLLAHLLPGQPIKELQQRYVRHTCHAGVTHACISTPCISHGCSFAAMRRETTFVRARVRDVRRRLLCAARLLELRRAAAAAAAADAGGSRSGDEVELGQEDDEDIMAGFFQQQVRAVMAACCVAG